MRRLLLAVLLALPGSASALLCERNGTCADGRLNAPARLERAIRFEGIMIRNEIRRARYLESQAREQRRYRGRRVERFKASAKP